VESDRLNKKDPALKDPALNAPILWPPTVTVPVFAKDAEGNGDVGYKQNFRYLGQVFDGDKWTEQQSQVRDDLEYLNKPANITPYKLTAIGYGDLNFASFYPNCCSVFGFCDTAASLREAGYNPSTEKLSYSVIGWYSDPTTDPVNYLSFKHAPPMDVSEEDYAEYLRSGLQLKDNKKGCYNSDYKWFFESSAFVKPVASLYNGIVAAFDYKFDGEYGIPSNVKAGHEIAVGNTLHEALSALLAAKLSQTDKNRSEELFNALQLGVLNQIYEPGGKEKVQRALHDNRFSSQSGGTKWRITLKQNSESSQAQTNQKTRPDLPAELIEKANKLSNLEWELSQLTRQLVGLRQQLMADWRKYLYFKRTLRGQMPQGSVPHQWSSNQTNFNQAIDIMTACLDGLIEAHNTLQEDLDEKQKVISNTKNDIANFLATQSLSQYYELTASPAPQYHQPNEPVLLLSGPGVKPPDNYGKLSRRDDGFLECTVDLPTITSSSITWTLEVALKPNALDCIRKEAIVTYMDALLKQAILLTSNPASSIDAWLPLMMEWAIQEMPIERLPLDNKKLYSESIITSNYDLDPVTGDFEAKKDGQGNSSPNGYGNLVPLAAGVTISLQYQIDQCLQQLAELAASDSPTTELTTDLKKLQLQELKQQLSSKNWLAQALSGFNTALIMRKETYQLPISDPGCSQAWEENLAHEIRKYVNQDGNLGENSGGGFSPLRAGKMHLSELRVIDCFGRKIDLTQSATPLILAKNLLPNDPNLVSNRWISLPPRIVPPSRLLLNWVPTKGEKVRPFSSDENPICGWVMFNYLDKSLQIYDPQGFALGSILFVMRDGNAQVHWQGQPGTMNWDKTLTQVMESQNETLRAFVEKVGRNSQYTLSFFEMLNRTLALSPNKIQDDANPAILIGKPLAVVRAWMKFEVNGNFFPLSQRWEDLSNLDVNNVLSRNNQVLNNVNLPIRLGESTNVEDGLVGFFKHDDKGKIDTSQFYAAVAIPQGNPGSHSQICRPTDQTLLLKANPQFSQIVTMLIDPYGKVNVTTGLLPAQTLELSPEIYIKPLQQIKATFLVSPILGPQLLSTDSASSAFLSQNKLSKWTACPPPTPPNHWSSTATNSSSEAWDAWVAQSKYIGSRIGFKNQPEGMAFVIEGWFVNLFLLQIAGEKTPFFRFGGYMPITRFEHLGDGTVTFNMHYHRGEEIDNLCGRYRILDPSDPNSDVELIAYGNVPPDAVDIIDKLNQREELEKLFLPRFGFPFHPPSLTPGREPDYSIESSDIQAPIPLFNLSVDGWWENIQEKLPERCYFIDFINLREHDGPDWQNKILFGEVQPSKVSSLTQKLPMIVPNESLHQGSWSWLERQLNPQNLKGWQTREPVSTDLAEVISYSPQILREGWLLLSHNNRQQPQPLSRNLGSKNSGIQKPDPILPPVAPLSKRRRFRQQELEVDQETPNGRN
jgi:hypothetical protein